MFTCVKERCARVNEVLMKKLSARLWFSDGRRFWLEFLLLSLSLMHTFVFCVIGFLEYFSRHSVAGYFVTCHEHWANVIRFIVHTARQYVLGLKKAFVANLIKFCIPTDEKRIASDYFFVIQTAYLRIIAETPPCTKFAVCSNHSE